MLFAGEHGSGRNAAAVESFEMIKHADARVKREGTYREHLLDLLWESGNSDLWGVTAGLKNRLIAKNA